MEFGYFHFFCYKQFCSEHSWTCLLVSMCSFRAFFSWQKFIKLPAVAAPISQHRQMPSPPGRTLHPKCRLGPSVASADPASLHLCCPPALSVFLWLVSSGSQLWPVPSTTHFSRTLPYLCSPRSQEMTSLFIFLRKMRWPDESSHYPSLLSNFSAFPSRRTVNMFCKPQILYGMNGGVHFFKSFSDPALELCLSRSCTIFKITNSSTLWPQPPALLA